MISRESVRLACFVATGTVAAWLLAAAAVAMVSAAWTS